MAARITTAELADKVDTLTESMTQLMEIVTAERTESAPKKAKTPKAVIVKDWTATIEDWKSVTVTKGGNVKFESEWIGPKNDTLKVVVFTSASRAREQLDVVVTASGAGIRG